MSHSFAVITQPCIGVKDGACVEVCPVDCIYEGDDQFFIHPDDCIDCGACFSVCPTAAIFSQSDVPADQESFIQKARDHFGL
jgi:NAD-dependent dihydropyrimidine dehydrogenase PreA subunit